MVTAMRIQRVRQEMTLQDLGEVVGVTRSHLSKIEKRERSPGEELAERIAQALQLDIETLFEDGDEGVVAAVERAA